ncbi:MAG TPA: hypothetical protein VK112_10955, partial [Fodinibius sp.]|nr:hypothetical protein [Fodinibius sp.]
MRFLYLFFAAITLLLVDSTMSSAQNTVTVNQKGDGNKVSISQSSLPSDAAEKPKCEPSVLPQNQFHNAITVAAIGNQSDTLLHKTGSPSNIVSVILNNLYQLEARQQGKENALSILIPDSSEVIHRFDIEQKEDKNIISARFSEDV